VSKLNILDSRSHCPTCGELLDAFSHQDPNAKPIPGDLTICVYCSEVLEFTNTMDLKLASPETIESFDFVKLSRAQKAAKREREAKKSL